MQQTEGIWDSEQGSALLYHKKTIPVSIKLSRKLITSLPLCDLCSWSLLLVQVPRGQFHFYGMLSEYLSEKGPL